MTAALARALADLGDASFPEGSVRAVEHVERAVDLADDVNRHGDRPHELAHSLTILANLYTALGRYDEALRCVDRAITSIGRTVLLDLRISLVKALAVRGAALWATERSDEAEESLRQARDIADRLEGSSGANGLSRWIDDAVERVVEADPTGPGGDAASGTDIALDDDRTESDPGEPDREPEADEPEPEPTPPPEPEPPPEPDPSSAAYSAQSGLVHDQVATEDLLGRRALAAEIAALLRELAEDDGRPEAFALHLDAPWGAGKSTLVGFVREELEQEVVPDAEHDDESRAEGDSTGEEPDAGDERTGRRRSVVDGGGESGDESDEPDAEMPKPAWLVITLDAWRSSQFSPAWWALLSHLRKGVRSSLSWPRRIVFDVRRFMRNAARLWKFWLPPLVAFAAILVWEQQTPDRDVFGAVGAIAAGLALAVTVGAIGTTLLSLGSVQGARLHERLDENPMKEVADQLRWLRARTKHPILLVIDDIDRCNETFAVQLLDAVQTLMRSPTAATKRPAATSRFGRWRQRRRERAADHEREPTALDRLRQWRANRKREGLPQLVVLGVGDHRWMRAAYENAYHVFSDEVSEPGRPLGHLFLDKLFQLRIELPKPNRAEMTSFIETLGPGGSTAGGDAEPAEPLPDSERAKVKQELLDDVRQVVARGRTERRSIDNGISDILRRADERPLTNKDIDDIVGAALAARRTDPGRKEREDYLLARFGDLMEPNPRAAKRFVMAYNLTYASRLAARIDVDDETLALWTVVSIRWPALADWVREQLPGSLAPVGDADHPSQLQLDHEVNRVINSPIGGPLRRENVLLCCGFRPDETATANRSS